MEGGGFSDNERAKGLYRKCGCYVRVFKLKDGTYRDEIIMVKML